MTTRMLACCSGQGWWEQGNRGGLRYNNGEISVFLKMLLALQTAAFLLIDEVTWYCTAQWSLYVQPSGHYLYRTVVSICTAQWSLYVQPTGHYMYRTVVTICTAKWPLYVPHSSQYMYRTVVSISTAQWSLYVPHSGHYMYRQFNIQQFYVLPTQCIYVFCVDLRTNSDYFPIQH